MHVMHHTTPRMVTLFICCNVFSLLRLFINCILRQYIFSGCTNKLADDLSRNHVASFLSQAPHTCMPRLPTPLPLMALDLLMQPDMDWSSPAWIGLFRSIVH